MPVAVGETFERYTIESLIGRGGMGEVYRAVDTRLRRKVALKVLRPDRDNAEAVARLFREARAAAVLTHPNTVAIHDIGESEGIFYIVMELVTGSSLLAYVGDARVPAARKLAWLVDVARALSAAHKAGVVHRDVKPSNVMVSDDGVVKVLDFGLAKPMAPVSFRTQQGHVLGTPRYMAPEQLAGSEVDARSDQYAYALTAYELVAGKHPGGALVGSIVPPRLDQVVPEVSRAVADVVARAMANKPALRFASMEDVAVALEDAIAGRPARDSGREREREHGGDGGEVTALESADAARQGEVGAAEARAPVTQALPETTPPITDTVRFESAPTAAAPTSPAAAPTKESESNVPTATARTVATAVEPLAAGGVANAASPSFGSTLPLAMAPAFPPALAATVLSPAGAAPVPIRTLMSREAPSEVAAIARAAAAAGGATPLEEAVRIADVRAEADAKTAARAEADAQVAAGARAKADADARAAAGARAKADADARAAAGDAEVKRRVALAAVAAVSPAPASASASGSEGDLRAAGVPRPGRWPWAAAIIVVIGACAFVGAYLGSKHFGRAPAAPLPSASTGAPGGGVGSSASVAPVASSAAPSLALPAAIPAPSSSPAVPPGTAPVPTPRPLSTAPASPPAPPASTLLHDSR